jgi:hypothetical protein
VVGTGGSCSSYRVMTDEFGSRNCARQLPEAEDMPVSLPCAAGGARPASCPVRAKPTVIRTAPEGPVRGLSLPGPCALIVPATAGRYPLYVRGCVLMAHARPTNPGLRQPAAAGPAALQAGCLRRSGSITRLCIRLPGTAGFWPTHSPPNTADGFLHRLFWTQSR